MKRSYVGLDVGSHTCHLVALDAEGRSVRNLQFPTSEAKLLTAIAGLPGEVQVHLEASELAGASAVPERSDDNHDPLSSVRLPHV